MDISVEEGQWWVSLNTGEKAEQGRAVALVLGPFREPPVLKDTHYYRKEFWTTLQTGHIICMDTLGRERVAQIPDSGAIARYHWPGIKSLLLTAISITGTTIYIGYMPLAAQIPVLDFFGGVAWVLVASTLLVSLCAWQWRKLIGHGGK